MQAYIHDGYTEKAYLAPVPRVHGEIRFTYRPMTISQRARMLEQIRNKKADASLEVEFKTLMGQVVDWSLVDRDDAPLPPTAANAARLYYVVWEKIRDVILFGSAPDTDPDSEPQPHCEDDAKN